MYVKLNYFNISISNFIVVKCEGISEYIVDTDENEINVELKRKKYNHCSERDPVVNVNMKINNYAYGIENIDENYLQQKSNTISGTRDENAKCM